MNMRLTTNLWSLLSHGIACCQLIPFHKLSFCSHPTNRWFRSIDLWPLPLSYLTCPNQQIYNKIYQDKIVCTAAITSCGNGSAWALALSLLDEMPRQLAMPDVSSCQASAWTSKVQAQWIECSWNTLKNIEEWIFPKNICQTNTKKAWYFPPKLGGFIQSRFPERSIGWCFIWFSMVILQGCSESGLMVATGAACCPSISMS